MSLLISFVISGMTGIEMQIVAEEGPYIERPLQQNMQSHSAQLDDIQNTEATAKLRDYQQTSVTPPNGEYICTFVSHFGLKGRTLVPGFGSVYTSS